MIIFILEENLKIKISRNFLFIKIKNFAKQIWYKYNIIIYILNFVIYFLLLFLNKKENYKKSNCE